MAFGGFRGPPEALGGPRRLPRGSRGSPETLVFFAVFSSIFVEGPCRRRAVGVGGGLLRSLRGHLTSPWLLRSLPPSPYPPLRAADRRRDSSPSSPETRVRRPSSGPVLHPEPSPDGPGGTVPPWGPGTAKSLPPRPLRDARIWGKSAQTGLHLNSVSRFRFVFRFPSRCLRFAFDAKRNQNENGRRTPQNTV